MIGPCYFQTQLFLVLALSFPGLPLRRERQINRGVNVISLKVLTVRKCMQYKLLGVDEMGGGGWGERGWLIPSPQTPWKSL